MKSLTYQHVIVIVAFLACVTILGITGNETAAIIAVGVALLGGLGVNMGQTQAVKENTNGNANRLMEINQQAAADQSAATARALELLEANHHALVALAHKMGTMTSPEQLTLIRADHDKAA